MIGSLRGVVLHKEEGGVLVEVNGVGYFVLSPTTLLDSLESGMQVQLFTHLYVREQELTLFGFPNQGNWSCSARCSKSRELVLR
jgi:Holliday junction DNA helicase RuvA